MPFSGGIEKIKEEALLEGELPLVPKLLCYIEAPNLNFELCNTCWSLDCFEGGLCVNPQVAC